LAGVTVAIRLRLLGRLGGTETDREGSLQFVRILTLVRQAHAVVGNEPSELGQRAASSQHLNVFRFQLLRRRFAHFIHPTARNKMSKNSSM
jgi:hypothetical protein